MEYICGRSWAQVQLMQGSTMKTFSGDGNHWAEINKDDLVGSHSTEIGLCMALDEHGVSPRVLRHAGQYSSGDILVNEWVKP